MDGLYAYEFRDSVHRSCRDELKRVRRIVDEQLTCDERFDGLQNEILNWPNGSLASIQMIHGGGVRFKIDMGRTQHMPDVQIEALIAHELGHQLLYDQHGHPEQPTGFDPLSLNIPIALGVIIGATALPTFMIGDPSGFVGNALFAIVWVALLYTGIMIWMYVQGLMLRRTERRAHDSERYCDERALQVAGLEATVDMLKLVRRLPAWHHPMWLNSWLWSFMDFPSHPSTASRIRHLKRVHAGRRPFTSLSS